jgi:glycosyltransferase involved in cell wall biosynthesis
VNVLLDVASLRRPGLTGVGIYVQQLLKAMGSAPNLKVTAGLPILKRSKQKLVRSHGVQNIKTYWPWGGAGVDLFHAPDGMVSLPAGRPAVVTLHDMFVFHDDFSNAQFLRDKREKFKRYINQDWRAVITPSEYVAREVKQHCPELGNRIHVVPHGVDHIPRPQTVPRREIREPYFLFVGTLEIRKNVMRLLQAFAELGDLPNHRLVLVGGGGFGFEKILRQIQASPRGGRIRQLGHVPMGERLFGLFHHAEALVLPSLAEGFCIPLLEAMRADCPVLTATTSATGEVLGSAGVAVDPLDHQAIAHGMRQLAQDRDLRENLIQAGRARQAEFTWERAARETVRVYEKALSRKN